MINRLKDEKGQILPFVALTLLALVMFWMTVVNVGKMVRDRIMLQNAADAAAQSAACVKAKALNSIGKINALLGIPVFTLGWPEFVWWPYINHNVPKFIIQGLTISQNILYFLSGLAAYRIAHVVARENGADGIDALLILSSREREFFIDGSIKRYSLKRNKGTVIYWDTKIVYVYGIPVPIPSPPHEYKNAGRWFELNEDEDKIHNALKVTVVAVKKAERGFFPLGKTLLGIEEMPEIRAKASARVYNTRGPMFPSPGEKWGTAARKAYSSAKSGGYKAHLVPVGSPYQH